MSDVGEDLDNELRQLFIPEGESIKSALRIISSPSTDPIRLTRSDARIESSRLLDGLLAREREAIEGHYVWRTIAERLSSILRMARNESRGYRRRRAYKTGMQEVERKYKDR